MILDQLFIGWNFIQITLTKLSIHGLITPIICYHVGDRCSHVDNVDELDDVEDVNNIDDVDDVDNVEYIDKANDIDDFDDV